MPGQDGRVEIPLRMLEGNLDVLLENKIPCNYISLRRDTSMAGDAVILVIESSGPQKEIQRELGFKSTTLKGD